jgi:hypothetical protein
MQGISWSLMHIPLEVPIQFGEPTLTTPTLTPTPTRTYPARTARLPSRTPLRTDRGLTLGQHPTSPFLHAGDIPVPHAYPP